MGSLQATEFASAVAEGTTRLDAALEWHLTSNHYPPAPLSMVGPCKRAIANVNAGEWDKRVRLPKGITWRGEKSAPTSAIIEGHHLESFLAQDEDNFIEDEEPIEEEE